MRFVNDLVFFLLVKVALLSIVFGIIIDTFAGLRDESHKIEVDKKNVCFICGAKRSQLEKNCINFEDHSNHEHNIWNYADYIVGLKFIDIQETNATNSYVMEKIQSKSIAWFPSYKTNLGEEEDDNREEEN